MLEEIVTLTELNQNNSQCSKNIACLLGSLGELLLHTNTIVALSSSHRSKKCHLPLVGEYFQVKSCHVNRNPQWELYCEGEGFPRADFTSDLVMKILYFDQQKDAWFMSDFCVSCTSCFTIDNRPLLLAKLH